MTEAGKCPYEAESCALKSILGEMQERDVQGSALGTLKLCCFIYPWKLKWRRRCCEQLNMIIIYDMLQDLILLVVMALNANE